MADEFVRAWLDYRHLVCDGASGDVAQLVATRAKHNVWVQARPEDLGKWLVMVRCEQLPSFNYVGPSGMLVPLAGVDARDRSDHLHDTLEDAEVALALWNLRNA